MRIRLKSLSTLSYHYRKSILYMYKKKGIAWLCNHVQILPSYFYDVDVYTHTHNFMQHLLGDQWWEAETYTHKDLMITPRGSVTVLQTPVVDKTPWCYDKDSYHPTVLYSLCNCIGRVVVRVIITIHAWTLIDPRCEQDVLQGLDNSRWSMWSSWYVCCIKEAP